MPNVIFYPDTADEFVTLAPDADLVLAVPAGGVRVEYHITPSAAITLTMDAAIKIPAWTQFDNATGMALTGGLMTIVVLKNAGPYWMLNVMEGEY